MTAKPAGIKKKTAGSSQAGQPAPNQGQPEQSRLEACRRHEAHWKRWGPYLSERQWGTVREDYSPDGEAWDYLSYDDARAWAYRWGEDGIGGICDNHQRLCFALGLWNGADGHIKERLFGLNNHQGNHGEDVKEVYFYLDSSPTHSYLKFLYKYPQQAFPYDELIRTNAERSRDEREYELTDTGIFAEQRYFDVQIEYAKASPEDLLIRIEVSNRGPDSAALHLLPQLWFRNTWSWDPHSPKPRLSAENTGTILAHHASLGDYRLYAAQADGAIFCENESNTERLYGVPNQTPYPKDSFHRWLVADEAGAVNPALTGTKAAWVYQLQLAPGETRQLNLRLSQPVQAQPFAEFDQLIAQRRQETDAFYAELTPYPISDDLRRIQRQAFAGLLWTKQFYHYAVHAWRKGDPGQPPPPDTRDRNSNWNNFYADDILSMPDKWEYPWFAAWDTAFHAVAFAPLDAEYAKRQLDVLTREWYMHPNGQLPAYEWNFDDVNPPVHAWATWRVYKIDQASRGSGDRQFLERVFQKLLLNFTWWVNRKDAEGHNIFEGGFLGLDNIGVFDRSAALPGGGRLEQADGSSWMAMYSLNMLIIALELAQENPVYEDIASKFFEHFLIIADALHRLGGTGLWDSEDGFYYDALRLPDGRRFPLRLRSMVGLIPLFAVETLEPEMLARFPGFSKRVNWFLENRPKLANRVITAQSVLDGSELRRLLSVVNPRRLRSVLTRLLDSQEFLSLYGVRSLSQRHAAQPYELRIGGELRRVDYEPAESRSGMFGGNSNWRGPVWFPLNFLLIESLQKFYHFFGDEVKIVFPADAGEARNYWEIASELGQRLISLFQADAEGWRPYMGEEKLYTHRDWREHLLFYEYFDGDTGRGLGASHQTGWTALVAKLIQQHGQYHVQGKSPHQR